MKEGGRWWWKVVVVGALWEEMKKMNGDGDVGDGNALASLTGTAYTGEFLNGWQRFGDVLVLSWGRFGDVLVSLGASFGYLWPNGLASVTGAAYTGELLVGR